MKGLAINTENLMRFKTFSEPLLDSLQKEVGGCIEVVHPKYLPKGFCMVVNDAGLLMELPLNRFCSVLYGTPEHGRPIVGNGVILKEGFVDGERDFVEMSDDDQLTLIVLITSLGNVTIRPESEVS